MSLNNLEPYLKHIGNCKASNHSPIDESCICGLRQTYFRLNVLHTKMQSVTRYIQRIDYAGREIAQVNLNEAIKLAKDL